MSQCTNDGNYQKFSCIINSGQITPPKPKIDLTRPVLKRLRKISDLEPSKKQRHDSETSSDADADECGNLDGFITYEEFDPTPPKQPATKEEAAPEETGIDQEYEQFISTLKPAERKQLKQIEAELAIYTQAMVRPLKYQILASKADISIKLIMMEKFKSLAIYDKTSSEYGYELTTLNQLLKIPWQTEVSLPIKISDQSEVIQQYLLNTMTFLDSVTYGQNKAKSTLLLELTRYLENPSSQGFILGVKGPPGSGKTTLISQGLAKILNRPFFRVDLGGAKHSDSLFGTRKVFDRSDAGDLVKILINARCINPIILFDELDKISTSEYGHELSNALNDLTDINRNHSILDQYLGISIDFSKVIIVFAYNSSDQIQETLRSRIHEIEIEPYTIQDKIQIATKFFIPQSCTKLNFDQSSIQFTNEAIKTLIRNYTGGEAGVRELARRIDEIILKINWLKLTQNQANPLLSDCYCQQMGQLPITNPMIMDDDWTTVSVKKKKLPSVEVITKKPSKVEVTDGPHPLADQWVCWFHDLNNENWSLASYQRLFTFETIEDFWIMCNNLKNTNNGMYYLMRNGYPPIWDHEQNIDGGGWTFKVDKKIAHDFWEKLACYCVGETLSTRPENVIGVSISPKVRFVTIRLWTKYGEKNASEFAEINQSSENESIGINFENARFTPNKEASK